MVAFQSTHPLRGATSSDVLSDSRLPFQSTHPLRGATSPTPSKTSTKSISIHAPLAGCDLLGFVLFPGRADFNPRTPCGVRHGVEPSAVTYNQFQSTHPLRGATAGDLGPVLAQNISIHAPLAGCDCHVVGFVRAGGISIHAPLAGCDASTLLLVLMPARFQSTHPLRGATSCNCGRGSAISISIHAPLAGCDVPTVTSATCLG